MTINTTANRTNTVGDATTTAYTFPYLFFANDDLEVILVTTATGVEVVQTITTHYTVTGAGVTAGGTVTMVTPPATTETLVIIRKEQFTQGLDLVENDPFPSDNVEQQFDILTMLAQQTDNEIKRAMRLSDGDTSGLDTTMPTPAANEFLRFDAAGTALTSAGLADLGTVAVPGSSTDNAVVRFSGTGGATLQNSVVLIGDTGVVTGVDTINGNDADTLLVDADLGVSVQAFDAQNAVTDAAQTFTVSQRGTTTTDNDLSFDLNTTNNWKCTPAGTGTLTFTNITVGQSGNILLINSGGHAISLHANTKGDANLASTISTAGTYWLSYFCGDGTNVQVVTSAVFA